MNEDFANFARGRRGRRMYSVCMEGTACLTALRSEYRLDAWYAVAHEDHEYRAIRNCAVRMPALVTRHWSLRQESFCIHHTQRNHTNHIRRKIVSLTQHPNLSQPHTPIHPSPVPQHPSLPYSTQTHAKHSPQLPRIHNNPQ